MERDDRVLCVYDNAYRYTARVLATYDNPDFAKSVWGEGEGGNTWRYMYFLTQPRKTDRHVSELADYLNAAYFGFTRISDEKLDAIATAYGSVEEFVDRMVDQHTDDANGPALRTVLSWIRNLRTQASPDGRFYHKPLLLLALLDVLDTNPEHPDSFGYEELLRAFERLVEGRGSTTTEAQFSQPYVRMSNDASPLRLWLPELADTNELEDSRAAQPAYVRSHAPSVRIADQAWPAFASTEGREAIRREIDSAWPSWFKPLEHPPNIEAELQAILERSNRQEQDLLAAIFRRAILLHQRHEIEGFLGAQPTNPKKFSITVGHPYACAVSGNNVLFMLVDDDPHIREAYEVGEAASANNVLVWIHGKLDRPSLQALLEDENVWDAYERMLSKVTGFPFAHVHHNNYGKLSVLTGEKYAAEPTSKANYWWVNQGATYQQERDVGCLWAPKQTEGGRVLSHHSDLLHVRAGDVILHYANGALRAVSEVTEPAEEAVRPYARSTRSQDTMGYLVGTRYHELPLPVTLENIPQQARVTEGGPFTRQGSVKQGYLFSLSPEFVSRLVSDFPDRWPDFLMPLTQQQRVWLVQANPRYVNLEQRLKGVRPGDEDDWTVTRFRQDMRAGDVVLLWQGGKNAGLYALGELIDEPYAHSYEEEDVPAWVTGKASGPDGEVTEWRVPYRYTWVLETPLYKSTLLEHPTLQNMQILRAPMGTNFKVSVKEWELLQELLGNGSSDGLDRGPLNVILYGPPGRGKTYSVQRRALRIIDPKSADLSDDQVAQLYRKYLSQGRIEFLTFHPSYSYEEFVEGYRYDVEAQVPTLHDGVFKTLVNRAVNPRQGSAVAEGARIWKVSLGRPSEPQVLEQCIANNEIGVGWLRDHNLADSDREGIKELFKEHQGGDRATNNINSVDYLVNELREGDYVAVFRNRREIQAIGVVTGDYQYTGKGHEGFPHTRPVEWLDRRVHDIYEMNGSTNLTRTTIYPLDRISLQDFVGLLPEHQKADEPYVLIIDEINRGNISRIFGELITLLEPDKRRGTQNELSVRLPYSQQRFTVPSNLYVVGTMNTADRSIALIDVALRRRFEFEEMMPKTGVIREVLSAKSEKEAAAELSADQIDLICHVFDVLNRRVTVRLDRDHQIGHSYLLDATSLERLHQVLYGRVFPLLQEYFYNDWESLRLVLGEYDAEAKNKGFVASLESEYDNVLGEDAPIYEVPSEFHVYDPDELEEALRNTFGSP